MKGYCKFFPRPTFASVNEDGCISLEWVTGAQGSPEQKRCSIIIDTEDNSDGEKIAVYGIYVDRTRMQDYTLTTLPDILNLLQDEMGLKAE